MTVHVVADIRRYTAWYSLCPVIAAHVRALRLAGESVRVWVGLRSDVVGWPPDIRPTCAPIDEPGWFSDLEPGPVVLHDTSLIESYSPVGRAAAKGLNRPHAILSHSGVTQLQHSTWNDYSTFFVLNSQWTAPVSQMTGRPAVVIPNPYDPIENASTPWSKAAMRWAFSRFDAPLLMTMPFEGGRWRGKGLDDIVSLIEGVGDAVDIVVFLCVSNPQPCMFDFLARHQMLGRHVFPFYAGYHGVPRDVVQDLFRLSDFYACCSLAEASSMTVIEACAAGNLVFYDPRTAGLRLDRAPQSIAFSSDHRARVREFVDAISRDRSIRQKRRLRAARALRPYGRRMMSLLRGLANGTPAGADGHSVCFPDDSPCQV